MRRAVLAAAVAGLVVASCDDVGEPASQDSTAVPADATIALPSITLLVPSGIEDVPIDSLASTAVTEPCPGSNPLADAGAEMATESSRLEPMLGQVLPYASQHSRVFGSYGLIWHDSTDASVFVSFTGLLDEHRRALLDVAEFPDELIVCQVALAGDVARALQAQLVDELEGRFLSIGLGGSGIEVVVAANEVSLADELRSRYGDAIDLTVGALAYPIERASRVCSDPPVPRDLPGLQIEIAEPTAPISAAGTEPANLTVTLTNVGDAPIGFNSGTAIGTILDAGGQVVNSNPISVADVGIYVDLAPGASTELRLVFTTASCDPDLGYTVPAGPYQLIAEVPHADGELTALVSEPATITIAP